jgi:hypothetical protein
MRSNKAVRAICLLPVVLILLLFLPGATIIQSNDWRVGNLVGLCQGTEIREGPGVNYCYHTVVPENNWTVRVINGPITTGDGRIWYDTSRREAGDPSGGTGWVNIQQADRCPAPSDGGVRCVTAPGDTIAQPTGTPIVPPRFDANPIIKLLNDILRWWSSQPLLVKIGVVVIAVILLPVSMRLSTFGSQRIVGLARAILWGIILGGIADLTRPTWEATWHSIAGGASGIDLAMVLLLLPLLFWAFGLVTSLASQAIAVVILVILVLVLLAFIAPDRLSALMEWIGRLGK